MLAQYALQTQPSLDATTESELCTAVAEVRLAQTSPNEVPAKPGGPVVTLSRLLVNSVLSFVQEDHASTAVAALRARPQIIGRVLCDRI